MAQSNSVRRGLMRRHRFPGYRLFVSACAAGTLACSDVGQPASSSAPADTSAGAVEFRLAGPGDAAIVVPVHINGRGPYNLIMDTGATFTCVDSALARELALPAQRGVLGRGVGIGGGGRVQLVHVDSLRVGRATASGLTACAMDLANLRVVGPQVRGLLGLNFLRNFRVTLDFRHTTLLLTQPEEEAKGTS
jgi:predicted aspartyl protease